jgi:predicted transcriptional regulator
MAAALRHNAPVPTPRSRRPAQRPPLVGGWRGALGPLEAKLLDRLWQHRGPMRVREVRYHFPELAYTTVMTTLDRLYRKGVLGRRRCGRAFAYEPRQSRAEMLRGFVAAQVLRLWRGAEARTAILSTLVRAAGGHDAATLDELEALIRAERARLQHGDEP